MSSGAALGEPRTFRFDCHELVEPGDWLVEKSIRTECGAMRVDGPKVNCSHVISSGFRFRNPACTVVWLTLVSARGH